uniref:Uncharacterized protein n=1 Tax=Arundo donax TaxID=35708 RepID=A0A0A9HVB6_ARUDO
MYSLNVVFLLMDTILNIMVRLLVNCTALLFSLMDFQHFPCKITCNYWLGLINSHFKTFSLFPGTEWLSLFFGAAPM